MVKTSPLWALPVFVTGAEVGTDGSGSPAVCVPAKIAAVPLP